MKHVPMRVSLVLAAIALVGIASVGAQLFPPDNLGMRMGHVLLNVSDPWGVTLRLTEGLAQTAGVTAYTYVDGFVVTKAIE